MSASEELARKLIRIAALESEVRMLANEPLTEEEIVAAERQAAAGEIVVMAPLAYARLLATIRARDEKIAQLTALNDKLVDEALEAAALRYPGQIIGFR